MNIGRHNYEEFFLLYADNELCAADRKAVEVFVAENPDLKKELQLLLQTISNGDAVVFDNKEFLMKPAITPLQEQLLLFIDDAQTAADKQKTQQLINTNTEAAKEFFSLQQTKLQPDTSIVYTNKKELYRKEEGRVVRIAWWRVAAAAVLLLGFGTWGVLTLVKPAQTESGTIVKGTNPKPAQQTTATNSVADAATKQTPVKESSTAAPVAANNTQVNNNSATIKNTQPANNLGKQQNATAVADNNNDKLVKKENNNLPQPINNPRYNNFNNDDRNKTAIANVTPLEDATNKVNSGNTNLVASNIKPNTDAVNGYAITAAYNPDEAEEVNNNKVLYMNEDNVKRSKLGGFIRKVKRVVERTTSIKTDNSIKVAGFDIALNK